MGPAQRLSRWARRLLVRATPAARRWGLSRTEYGPVLWSSDVELSRRPLILSPGFGSSVYDYAPLAALFGRQQPVLRVGHPGSDRRAALGAGLRMLGYRLLRGHGPVQAARKVRAHIHRPESRRRRLRQVAHAVQQWQRQHGVGPLDLAGHSFGSDTALCFALRYGREFEIDTLYLFSPHPPGYLVSRGDYVGLPVRQVIVVVGSRDRTRDGVGPEQRLEVMQALGDKARAIVLDGVAHMDFAFADLGPPGWPKSLAEELRIIGAEAAQERPGGCLQARDR